MAERAVFVGPFVPDSHSVFLKVVYVGVAFEEPEEFVDYALEVYFFCRYEREAFAEVEAHLVAES